MDDYLKSLVKKSKEEVKSVTEDSVDLEETSVVIPDNSTTWEIDPEPIEVADSVSTTEEIVITSTEDEQPPKDVKVEELTINPDVDLESASLEIGKEYSIGSVRVYNSPNTHQSSQLISGKVIYEGKSGTFSIIKYMKHGFGIVKGYVNNLESALK